MTEKPETEPTVWCYCYGTPEPTSPWISPDDYHADVCVIDELNRRDKALCAECEPGMHVNEECIACGEDIGHGTASGRCRNCDRRHSVPEGNRRDK